MLDKSQIIILLETLHEHVMAKDIFVNVFKKMGLKGVRFTGGADEQGIDVEYHELTTPDKVKLYTGIQFKKGDITYGSRGTKNTTIEIRNQAEEAFRKEIVDVEGRGKHFINRFIVAATGDINEPARKYIGKARISFIDRRIDYWNGDRLAEYIQDHYLSEFELYFKGKIPKQEEIEEVESVVDANYIKENYEKEYELCRKLFSTVNEIEKEILTIVTIYGGDIDMSDLLFEIERDENYIRDDLIHLQKLSYIEIDDEENNRVSLINRAENLYSFFYEITRELEDTQEDGESAGKIFKKLFP